MILIGNHIRRRVDADQGAMPFVRYGRETLASAGQWFDAYPGTTDERAFPSTVAPVTVESSSAANADGGTGAQAVTVLALDGDHKPHELVVPLAGTSPVALGEWLEILSMRVHRAGSHGAVEGGYVRAMHGDAGEISFIVQDRTHDAGCHFTQPAGVFAQCLRWRAHIDVPNQNDVAHARLEMAPPGEPWHAVDEFVITQDDPTVQGETGLGATLHPGTRYRAQCECSRTGATVDVRLHFLASQPGTIPRTEL